MFVFKHGNKEVKAKSTKLYHVVDHSSECTVGTTYTYQVNNIYAASLGCSQSRVKLPLTADSGQPGQGAAWHYVQLPPQRSNILNGWQIWEC